MCLLLPFLPHPLLFILSVGEQLPDVGLRLSDVLVEDLGTVDDLRLSGFEHFANLSSHQGFTAAWGSEQQDPLHVLTAWSHTEREREREREKKKRGREEGDEKVFKNAPRSHLELLNLPFSLIYWVNIGLIVV